MSENIKACVSQVPINSELRITEQISGIKNELTHRQRSRDVSFKKPVR